MKELTKALTLSLSKGDREQFNQTGSCSGA
jgi:hypothetical protein